MDAIDITMGELSRVLKNTPGPGHRPRENFVDREPPLYGLLNPDDEYGMVERGNIDLTKRPTVTIEDGSVATVRSISVGVDGRNYLIPTVSPDGEILSDNQAYDRFTKTHQHLGAFRDMDGASRYAEKLHQEQDELYGDQDNGTP